MECKFESGISFFFLPVWELIDTLWNVNYPHDYLIGIAPQELIDTLWNVNERGEQDMTVWNVELIDTLWNVNADSTKDNEVAYAN